MNYCCEPMWKQFEIESDDERYIIYIAKLGFALVDRKDPTSCSLIEFCPWCGKALCEMLGDG